VTLDPEDLRLAVYRDLARTGRAPTATELASRLDVSAPEVRDGLHALVSTRCPGCGRALAWVVGRDAPPAGEQVAHVLIPVKQMWDDVVQTCANQRLFCGQACVESWPAASATERGHVMDLAALWRLASHWYDGRLEPGYTRRDPSAAVAYFQSVGLRGPFWELDD